MTSTAATLEDNRAEAAEHLQGFASGPVGHLIAGESVPSASGEVFETYAPLDQTLLAEVASGDAFDIDRAANSSAEAFAEWSHTPGVERRTVLNRVADAIEQSARKIALVESSDTGQPIRFMQAAAIRGAENFRFFADRAPGAVDGQSLPTETHLNYTTRQPIGPVGVITPWNTPFMLSTWKIAPALASGCTVVHKPAEWSPLTAALLAEIALESGLPVGALNVVHGMGESAGKALTEHPLIAAIAFVGESGTGSLIQAQSAPTLKRLHFELGGKNPVIIFADADLDRAVDAAVFMIYSLNGERCTSSSRLLVERSISSKVEAMIADRVTALRVGDPLDPATEIGPLIHANHCEKVRNYHELAANEGATLHLGSTPGGPNFVAPVLFTNAAPSMAIAQEEIFGPALTMLEFDDESDAVRIANDVEYGLAGYVWTSNAARAHRVARDLDVGMVWVNSQNVRHLPTPFGGMKRSGIGRDGGDYSFDFYMETKSVSVALGDHPITRLGAG